MIKLSNIYNLILEDLDYEFTNQTGPEDDEYEIGKIDEIFMPNMRVPKQIWISDEERKKVAGLYPNQLDISQGEYDGMIANMNVRVPWQSEINNDGIIVDIQPIKMARGHIYQIHIGLAKQLQGLGLGYKIFVAMIHDLGHIYAGKGRRLNDTGALEKIWDKLATEPGISCFKNEFGNMCMLDKVISQNPEALKLFKPA